MSCGSGAGYDRHITIFSRRAALPKYAFKAVKSAGSPRSASEARDSVCVVTQKKVPDKLLDDTSITHLFSITKYTGLLATGLTDKAQIYTIAMVLGYDEEKMLSSSSVTPRGHFFGHKATSAGLKEQEAINFLEKKMKDSP
ncbi:hypothetical protein ZWY2020_036990 [Hordeum vulgare]|nr:hypothetical protein ZWY2020_036990 [Hordeum vulgare]